jgi:steroid 5-alpha reductase family enzyme
VDKLWSITPWLYVWHFAVLSQWHKRVVLMALVSTLWGIRLTYNFARRGGYTWPPWAGEEDYRWPLIREGKVKGMEILSNPLVFRVFNVFFISLYQHFLLMAIALPAGIAATDSPLNALDAFATAAFLAVLALEWLADEQQYIYQSAKWALRNAGLTARGEYAVGFCRTGLWGLSRHPNYTCEQALWCIFYLYGVAATGEWVNWTLLGAVLLIALFSPSADLSEGITEAKYPLYKEYRTRLPKFLSVGTLVMFALAFYCFVAVCQLHRLI